MNPRKIIEIEYRARFNEKKYKELANFLHKNAKDLGNDDKDVWFFLLPNKLLKVVNNISQKSAKIVLKLNKIGKGSDFEEIEIPIKQKDFDNVAQVFSLLKIGESMHSFQKRRNFYYKGVELALKWSELWGFHLELEIVINDLKQKGRAKDKIFHLAKELSVQLMSDKELIKFTKNAERKYKFKKKWK
jgi:adenylate cyclase class IV